MAETYEDVRKRLGDMITPRHYRDNVNIDGIVAILNGLAYVIENNKNKQTIEHSKKAFVNVVRIYIDNK